MQRGIAIVVAAAVALIPTDAFAWQEPPADEQPPAEEEARCDPDDPDDKDCIEPKIHIIGAGGGGGGFTFNWNGPGRLDYGVYDHGCINYEDEFRRLIGANQGLIGSVAAQAVGWDAMLATVRKRLASAKPPAMELGAPLVLAEPEVALAQLFTAVQKTPDDAGLLFNFAASLSRSGLPNEALAVIARIRALPAPPVLPLGVDSQAALDYQAGYAEMLRGNLAAAKAGFQSTIGREPFVNEAAHALALVQAHEGNSAAQKTYLAGMWRFKPKFLVLCGGQGSADVRPPVDDMYDTSMGKDVRLVEFWHPEIAGELKPFYEQLGALSQSRAAIAEPLKQRMIAMGDNPRFATAMDRPYDAWAEKLTQLIAGLDENEPYVLQQQEKLERAIQNAERIAGQNQAFVLERVTQLAVQPGNHCPTYRSLISQGIQGVRPHAERVEAEYRAYARVWYKMATGLASNIGDPEWYEYNDVPLRAEIEAMNLGMIAMMMGYYAFPADLVIECPEEFVDMFAAQVPPPEPADACKELFGNLKFKHTISPPKGAPGPTHDIEIGCDKIKVDSKYDVVNVSHGPLGLAMGGRFSGEFTRGKGFSMFAGVGADAKAFGAKGSVRAGAFVEGDYHGLTAAGGRVIPTRADGSSKPMDFNILPKPQTAPRGPALRKFYAPP